MYNNVTLQIIHGIYLSINYESNCIPLNLKKLVMPIVTIGATSTRYSAFGFGTGPIHIDNVECVGTEASLSDCPSRVPTSICYHYREAGVRCQIPTGKCIHIMI